MTRKTKQFIPPPWKVGDFLCRNINKIDEFVDYFKKLNLTYVERIKGLTLMGFFENIY
jgi:hypothetical protein